MSHVSQHVSQRALEGYVIGALSELECAELEAHVIECEACAARLAREASLELAFTAVAARGEERPRRVHLIAPALGATLAMAAAVLLWVLPRGEASEQHPQTADDQAPSVVDTYGDASATGITASLETQVDGSRVGVRD